MQIIPTLIRIGATGAALAFLILSYLLLKNEASRERVRPPMLVSTAIFSGISLLFFISGIFGQIITTMPKAEKYELIRYALSNFYKTKYVRADIVDIEYHPKKYKLAIDVKNVNFDKSIYTEEGRESRYRFIVALRDHTNLNAMHGNYPMYFGPYTLEDQPNIEVPTKDVRLLNKSLCVDATLFRIRDNIELAKGSVFFPLKYKKTVSSVVAREICTGP